VTDGELRRPGQPAVGWRYWQVVPDAGVLRSVSQRRFQWKPGRPLRAWCVTGGHAAPARACDCGVYAATDLQTLKAHGLCLAPERLVVGTVDLWGRVVDDGDGVRGEFAYPSRLLLVEGIGPGDRSSVMDCLAAYGVPVGTIPLEDAVGDVSAATLAFQAMSRRTEER
jgi:hypothetical protein